MAQDVIRFKIFADDAASGPLKKVNSVLKGGINITKKVALAAVGATTAITGFTSVVARHNDTQGKFSNRINVSVSELTAYQHAADLSGLSTQTFNLAVQRMTRRVSEAANGMGEARSALRELGIDAKAFQNLGLADQMSVLADSMGELENENDKLRLAFKLFDSEGTAVLQMLNQGSDAMREAALDAKFLGLVIDQDAAAKAALFNDKMTRATGAIKGLGNSIGAELMPMLSGLADSFADLVAENRANITAFVKGSIEAFFTIVDVAAQALTFLGRALSDPELLLGLVKNLHALAVQVGVMSLNIAQVLVRGIMEGVTLAKDLFLEFGVWVGESLAKLVLGEEVESIGDRFARIFTDGFSSAKDIVASTVLDIKDVVSDGAGDIGDAFTTAFDIDLDSARQSAKQMINDISLFAETTKESIKETEASVSEFAENIKTQRMEFMDWLRGSTQQFAETLRMTAQGAIESLSQGLANAIMTGTSLLDAFKNVAKQVVTQIIAAFIKLGIQRLILSKVMGGAMMSEATTGASKAVALAGANMFASMAAAPFPINLTAPAAAAAAQAGAAAAFTTGAAIGSGLGAGIGGATAVAHGGLTNNPQEQTALILKNERIISPRQNRDLTAALPVIESLPALIERADNTQKEGRDGVAIQTVNLNITMFPNVTQATDSVFEMDAEDVADQIGNKLIDALDVLSRRGLKPDFAGG